MRAQFGNTTPRSPGVYGDEPVTTVDFGEDATVEEAFQAMTATDGVVANQATDLPTWVSSDDDGLAQMLGDHYACPVQPYGGDSH